MRDMLMQDHEAREMLISPIFWRAVRGSGRAA